jgi:integrase
MGLGGWPDVGLTEARDRAREARRKVETGVDPIEQRRGAKSALLTVPTFRWCAEQTMAAKRPEWKNPKHAQQWENTLAEYAYPFLSNMPVDQIGEQDVIRCLTPIWNEKPETAKRVRMRIEAVLGWATVSTYRKGDNPARWRNHLDRVFAAPGKVRKVVHHAALPLNQLHEFVRNLREREGLAPRALEFLILTATRSGEVRGATWEEIDRRAALWTIPAERMKAGREHRVPLSPRALEILKELPRMAGNPHVFPAPQGGALSDMALSAVMRRMEVDAVPHGFRSTFRDWASERTSYPSEMAEMALAHTIDSKVEAAYRRGDLFAKRVKMMTEWARFIEKPSQFATVTPIAKARK